MCLDVDVWSGFGYLGVLSETLHWEGVLVVSHRQVFPTARSRVTAILDVI